MAALAIAVPFAIRWWRMRVHCADAEAAVLAVLPDALGTNGTYRADFSPKYDFTCKEMLVVEHDLPRGDTPTTRRIRPGSPPILSADGRPAERTCSAGFANPGERT